MVIHKRVDKSRFIDRRDACPTDRGTNSLKIKDILPINKIVLTILEY